MLRVRLLGELSLELDGRLLPAPAGRPTRSLLSWLAVHPGMHARSRLAGRLWPDVRDESARTSLRKAVADLRRALGPEGADALVATREGIGLAPAPEVWVDVLAFDELVAAMRLEEAIELCRGELLPELDDDWVYDARDEHRARLASAVARLGELAEQQGDLEQAAQRAREHVVLEPLAEQAHRTLMRRLVAAGDRAAALAAYARLRDRLRRELGVAPSPETRALAEAVRRGEVREAAAAMDEPPPLPSPLARRQRTAFVGRAEAIARLRDAWKLAQSGELQLVLVAGEPGIGKTRLAAEFSRSAHAAGAAVLLGRCYEEPLVPYQPFVEALRPLLATGTAEPAELARLVPGLAGEDGASADVGDDADAARFRLFEAATTALFSAARRWPLLLVLEDLHWADKPTLLLLAHVVRAPERSRIFIVATYRDADLTADHPLAAVLADLRREHHGERVGLHGLGEVEVAALMTAALGEEPSDALAHAVYRETAGNPFFVEEVIRHVAESAVLDRGERWNIAELGVPEGVREVIARRVARLGEDAVAALAAGAVLGREFVLEELRGVVAELPEERLVDALEAGLHASLIRQERSVVGRYGFVHALVREALYDGLTAAGRRRLHLRAAEALETLYGDRPDHLGEVAHHLFQSASAATAERAAEYGRRAGEFALGQLAYEEAAAHFDRALELFELIDRPAGVEQAELLLALGDAHMRAGDREEGRRAFGRAADAARAVARPDLLAHAAVGFGGIGVTLTMPDPAAVGLLEEALRSLEQGEDGLRARLLARLALELNQTEPARSESLSGEAIAIATAVGDAQTRLATLSARHVALPGPEHVEERLALADEMVAIAAGTGDGVAELQGRHWRVLDLLQLGDVTPFEQELDAYARLAREARLPVYEWYVPMWQATLAMLRGPLDDVRPLWANALALGRRAQDANAEIFFRSIERFFLPLEEGRADEADLEWVRQGIARPEVSWVYRTGAALILAGRGRIGEARAEFEAVAAGGFSGIRRDVHFVAGLPAWGGLAATLGDVARAELIYDLYLPFRHLLVVHPRAHYCFGWADHYLGLCAATASKWSLAVEHYDAALAHERRWSANRHVCRTLCAYADALLGQDEPGDRERARALAAEALETAEQLDAPNLVAQARAVAGEASLAPL